MKHRTPNRYMIYRNENGVEILVHLVGFLILTELYIYWHAGQFHRQHRVASAYDWVPTQALSIYPGDASESGSRVKVTNILEQ